MSNFPQLRLRRLREISTLRQMVRETKLSVSDFVYPVFVTHGHDVKNEIDAIPPRSPAFSWLTLDYDPEIVFGVKQKDLWESCVKKAIEQKSKQFVDKAFSTLHKS